MRIRNLLFASAFAASVLSSAASLAVPVYGTDASGSLTGARTILGGGLIKGGGTGTAAEIDWAITNNATYYHYSYTVDTDSQQGVAHVLIDLSSNCLNANYQVLDTFCFYNPAVTGGTLGSTAYGLYSWNSPGNSDPNMPNGSSISGVKISWTAGSSDFTFEFDSDRVPVWEDFYAKLGNGTTNGLSFFNTGLGNEATDGSAADFIPFPDSVKITQRVGTVPEPTTFALLAVGLLGLGTIRRRQKRPG